MLFNEPKLLKSVGWSAFSLRVIRFSALQRAEIAEMAKAHTRPFCRGDVSVLFNEPKLLKYFRERDGRTAESGFSALQRAEIAEIERPSR